MAQYVTDEDVKPRRRHKRSWLRRNRKRIYLGMMVVGGGLMAGGVVTVLLQRPG